jgi:hypothetical protein
LFTSGPVRNWDGWTLTLKTWEEGSLNPHISVARAIDDNQARYMTTDHFTTTSTPATYHDCTLFCTTTMSDALALLLDYTSESSDILI